MNLATPITHSIAEEPNISHFFEANQNFQKIHTSNLEAQRAHKIASECTHRATQLTQSLGLPTPKGLCVLSSTKKLHVFSVMTDHETTEAPHVFGITTALHVKTQDIVSKIECFLQI